MRHARALEIQDRKSLLAARALFDRAQMTVAVHDVKNAIAPPGAGPRGPFARGGASLLVGLVAPLVGPSGSAAGCGSPPTASRRGGSRATGADSTDGYNPRSFQSASTRALTPASIAIGLPHARSVSPGHLLVASIPILLPTPATGEAKSR